jgi:hypothetical protein
MNLPASWRALGRLAGWAVLILGGQFLAPDAARADCGDYVTTRLAHADMAPPDRLPPGAPKPFKPCSGPHCSGAPASPTAPAPAAPLPSQEWGLAPGGLLVTTPARAVLPPEPRSPRPTHVASGTFHPPRRSA